MNKKIMLLALAAVSAAVLALPAMASALTPLHMNPTPVGAQPIHGGTGLLSTTGGTTVHCQQVNGSATFEPGGTTGSMQLTFGTHCTENVLGSTCRSNEPSQPSGTIQTTPLTFHLATLPNSKPGVLVTGTNEVFAHIECAGGFIKFTVDGKGVIGTIEQTCGSISKRADIDFNATSHGQQEHKLLAGTATVYDLTRNNGETAAQDTTGTVTLSQESKLECT